jgi:hypothetical protein
MSATNNQLHNSELPLKRPRTDSPEPAPTAIPTSDSMYAHRRSLPSRATLSNAADNRHFAKSHALVYHFVDMYDIVEDELGGLKSCTLKCGICRRGGWRWSQDGKSKGSTSNMNNHMKDKHGLIWRSANQADSVARGTAHGMDLDVSLPASLTDTPVSRPRFSIIFFT